MTPHSDELAETVKALQQDVHAMPAAMAAALRDVLTDPEIVSQMMDIAISKAQDRAAKNAGIGLFKLLRGVLSHWAVVGLFCLLALKLLGVEAAVKVWRTLTGQQ